MQRKKWQLASLVILLIVVIKIIMPVIQYKLQNGPFIETQPLSPEVAVQILQTTIQITMYEEVIEKLETQERNSYQNAGWQKVERSTNGLGTLVRLRGEILLISHDHWSLFTSSTAPDKVTFRDAKGSLLVEMSGAELLPLILFHDSGTFILKAPEKLATKALATAEIGSVETISPGDTVHVVHHSPEQENQLSIQAAEVVGLELVNGVPRLSLRSLNGQSIEPGDSGGGIWVNGYLAGNLWMTVREVRTYWWQWEPSDPNETAFSLAAGLRLELVDLVARLLQVESPPSLAQDGLS